MSALHDEARELLPDYVKGGLPPKERQQVAAHLAVCGPCRQEAELLADLLSLEAPDPGEGFWKALPLAARQKAGTELPPGSRWKEFRAAALEFLTPAPALAAASLAVLVMVVSGALRQTVVEPEPRDPFAVSVIEYDDLSEADIADARIVLTDAEGYAEEAGFGQTTFHREFAALDDDELAVLEQMLMQKKNGGG